MTTRTRPVPMKDNLQFVSGLAAPSILTVPARQLAHQQVAAALYACTACSFVHGHDGERRLRKRMQASGIRQPWTTAGAVAEALTALRVRTVAIIHPYAVDVAARLTTFLSDAGFDVTASARIDVHMTEVDSIDATSLTDLVLGTDLTHADAVFISCTNVPTYDVIAPLEHQLGIPVVTANQAGMWAALRSVGVCACGPGQALLTTTQTTSR